MLTKVFPTLFTNSFPPFDFIKFEANRWTMQPDTRFETFEHWTRFNIRKFANFERNSRSNCARFCNRQAHSNSFLSKHLQHFQYTHLIRNAAKMQLQSSWRAWRCPSLINTILYDVGWRSDKLLYHHTEETIGLISVNLFEISVLEHEVNELFIE